MKYWVFGILIIVMMGFVLAGDVDGDIVEAFDSGEHNVEVIIELEDESVGVGAFGLDNVSVENIVDGEIEYQFENSVAVEISEDDLYDLSMNANVKSVVKMGRVYALLEDFVGIINASSTWGLTSSDVSLTGVGHSVCVIDSGINYSHPDLSGAYLGGYDFVGDDNDPMDGFGHGTHVAGIIAASGGISGVAPGVGIVAMRVLNDAGSGSPADLASAIDRCVANASVFNISVISMSLGCNASAGGYSSACDTVLDGCYNAAIASSINAAVAANISVVVSTGNFAETDKISSPACIRNAIAVSSVDDNDSISSFSDRNSLVNLLAPGEYINSTRWYPSGILNGCSPYSGNYMTCSGTSMVAPMVSGTIALIDQYLDLSGQSRTPLQIESILNDTGRRIYDADSGLNFSIIDAYAAVISLDVDVPNVVLVSPVDDVVDMDVSQTFVCNVTDWQLANVTLSVWNSGGLFYNASNDSGGVVNSFDVVGLIEGSYEWNCLGVDDLGNSAYASANFSLIIGGISTTLVSPVNGSYSNVDSNFSCRAVTESDYGLSNMTFYLWNASYILVYNSTNDISGTDNTTVFNYSFVDDGDYFWNCLGMNNVSNYSWGDSNYSFVFDGSVPDLTLTSLPTSVTSSSVSKNFGFNIFDDNLDNCSLIIGGVVSLTNFSINGSLSQVFSQIFTPGNYVWKINCSDLAGNVNSSVENSFVITAPSSPSGPSGSSSIRSSSVIASSVPNVYEVGVTEIESGYTKRLKKDDGVDFSIFDSEGGRHSLSVDEVGVDYVELIIESDPISLSLGVGQSAKLNLTSPDYYDLFVKLNAIVEDEAELTIQLINEPIEDKVIELVSKEVVETEVEVAGNYLLVVVILVVILVAIVFVILSKDREKSKKNVVYRGRHEKKLVRRELKLRDKGDRKRVKEEKKIKRAKAKGKYGKS